MCLYGFIVTLNLFKGEVRDGDLFNAIFYNGVTGQEAKADLWIVTHYLFMRYFPLASVFILMMVMCVVLTLFLCFHLWIAANGMTTNEFYKWRQVRKWHKREMARYECAKERNHDGKRSERKDIELKAGDGDVGCIDPTGSIEKSEKAITIDSTPKAIVDPGPFPKNIYNRGIIENCLEIIHPRSLRKDAIHRLAEARKKSRVANVNQSKELKSKKV